MEKARNTLGFKTAKCASMGLRIAKALLKLKGMIASWSSKNKGKLVIAMGVWQLSVFCLPTVLDLEKCTVNITRANENFRV